MKGDHYAMTFDFSSQQLFGNPTHQLHPPTTRGFDTWTESQSGHTYHP